MNHALEIAEFRERQRLENVDRCRQAIDDLAVYAEPEEFDQIVANARRQVAWEKLNG